MKHFEEPKNDPPAKWSLVALGDGKIPSSYRRWEYGSLTIDRRSWCPMEVMITVRIVLRKTGITNSSIAHRWFTVPWSGLDRLDGHRWSTISVMITIAKVYRWRGQQVGWFW